MLVLRWVMQLARPSTFRAAARLSPSQLAVRCAGDEARQIIVSTQHEGPGQAFHAVQKGAKLVVRLLYAFTPLAARLMAAKGAASDLMTKLEV
jgi:hypothetical protein